MASKEAVVYTDVSLNPVLYRLAERQSEGSNGIDGPPAKRRRLSRDDEDTEDIHDDEIAVAQVDMNIVFPDVDCKSSGLVLSSCYLHKPVNMSLSIDAAQTCSIALMDADNVPHFAFTATTGRPSPVLRGLQRALNARHGLKRQSENNMQSMIQTRSTLQWRKNVSSSQCKVRTLISVKDSATSKFLETSETRDILETFLAPIEPDSFGAWSPQNFYGNVHITSKSDSPPVEFPKDSMRTPLYPFQTRALGWLQRREGVEMEIKDENSGSERLDSTAEDDLPPSFNAAVDIRGRRFYYSRLLGIATLNFSSIKQLGSVSGGILAEEMGLGKTVELIALICSHQRNQGTEETIFDAYSARHVQISGATLIITPPSILKQWKDELAIHAPTLRVLHYEGMKTGVGELDDETLVKTLVEQDVVLCSYNVLSSEIHYAGPRPDRRLRHEKKYEPRRSPLVQISWWRVCLDEAQMVESGVSNAAIVARGIPRCHAWAVSGTPVRKDIKDLLGLLLFLRMEPYCETNNWNRLVVSSKSTFKAIFGQIALRHTKNQVRDELQLPPQKRVVITVPFTPIEEQNYNQLYQQMCDDCGFDQDGGPVNDSFDPDSAVTIEKMRSWLTRLRQTCLHPEVGGSNRRRLGLGAGPLRTVTEVLEVMIEQNESSMRAEERLFLMSKIRRGQIFENDKKPQKALEIWLQALKEATTIVEEIKLQLSVELEKLSSAKGLDDAQSGSQSDSDLSIAPEPLAESTTGANQLSSYRQRLRAILEIQHICTFFVATAYYQIKTNIEMTDPGSEDFSVLDNKESEMYEKAKFVRTEILSEQLRRTRRLMQKIEKRDRSHAFVIISKVKPLTARGGIEGRKVWHKFESLAQSLNDQAENLKKWRTKMAELLLRPLVDEEGDTELQGDEYETSTKHQNDLYVYLEALRAIVADRRAIVMGQRNSLIEHEMKVALLQAKEGNGPSPELFTTLLATCQQIKPSIESGSLREVVSDLRTMSTALQWQEDGGSGRAAAELAIIDDQFRTLQKVTTDQSKCVEGLEKEIDLFRRTMNSRLEYYRQLQQISDTVAPYVKKEGTSDESELSSLKNTEKRLAAKIATLKSKSRYLLHLRAESRSDSPQRMCIICQQTFDVGALTVCGHQYCKECIRMWWNDHRTCPTCKRHLNLRDFHQITYKPQELSVHEEVQPSNEESELKHKRMSIYANISTTTLNQIKSINIDGSFGTKIDTLARHILWLRENDPGAKSIVFSQYREFLEVLGRAFNQFKIGFASIDSKGGIEKFKGDASTECFLLHARAHSSGLNLVNATHVFLCEPLINTAIELQAIARVHRIGQHQTTTVWMYLVQDTVEECIYETSVSRRLAHMGRGPTTGSGTATPELQENSLDAANSLELQQAPLSKLLAKGPRAGEMVETDDLWNCLFRKTRRNQPSAGRSLGLEDEDEVNGSL